jgi:hypothetical protein
MFNMISGIQMGEGGVGEKGVEKGVDGTSGLLISG